ncbi:MFS transporter [Galbitalea sp. SE-J8]|uniref:MFS transporter n=1 Tax=Galbitalea sp. SE-J8 TaxID=3054952 RepID=UPI00259C8B90|nr:MFS transporter [Galbitalea sp. SE-J8]MDM4763186.1 MFS transporter [Galbitalea sp. SE-J8]
MNSRRAWVVFGVAVLAYVIAVLQRSSLGVAGVDATERFHTQALALSTLAVVQIVVYAGLQIPVGVTLDRVGPRALILAGAVVMVLGQLLVALAPGLGVAIAGRILVGAGDAMTFISAQRLVVAWFSGRRVPLVSQLLGTLGSAGQVLSAVPFALVLHGTGWTPAFLSAAACSVLAAVAVGVAVRDEPAGRVERAPEPLRAALSRLRDALRHPGTRLGFWAHFVTQSSGTVFSLLWGVPFLSIAVGLGPATASALLIVPIATGVLSGPLLGLLTARYPHRRSNVVLGIVVAMGVAWALVLAWPGIPPLPIVCLMLVAIGVGGPGSLIGFDYARTFNPQRSLGSANGIVNVGGFLASFTMMFLIGVVLDVRDAAVGGDGTPASLYALDGFRLAFGVQYLVVGAGVAFLIAERRATRRRIRADEGITVAPLWVALSRQWRRRE